MTAELFDLVSCGICRLAAVMPEALSMINHGKIYSNVVLNFNVEKRYPFNTARLDEVLM